jgi:O-antigen ligase
MNSRSTLKYNLWVLLAPAVLMIIAISYVLLNGNTNALKGLLAACAACPVAYLLLFRFQAMGFLLALAIPLSVPVGLGGGSVLSIPGELFTLVLALTGLAYYFVSSKKIPLAFLKHPITVLILIDIGWSVFTGFHAEQPAIAFKRILLKIFMIGVFYFIYSGFYNSLKKIALVYLLYAIGMIIPILWTIYNHSHYGFSKTVSFLMPLPFYNDHTLYATCIAFVLPVVALLLVKPGWYGYSRSLYFRLGILIIAALLITGELLAFSRAAWLSIFVALFFAGTVLYLRFRLTHFLVLLFILGGFTYQYSDEIFLFAGKEDAVSRDEDVGQHMRSVINIQSDASNMERINRWSCAVRMAEDRPLTGFGPGNYLNVYGRYQLTTEMTRISTSHGEKGNAHSEYLMYLSEMGIPGLFILVLLILFTVSKGIRVINTTVDKRIKWLTLVLLMGFVSYFFHGFFNSFIDTDKASILVYSCLAAIVALERKEFV